MCDRAGVSWIELQELPAYIVDGYLLDMSAQAEASRRQARQQEQGKG